MTLLDDAALAALAGSAAARLEFPFLRQPAATAAGCCGGRPQSQPDFNAMKAAAAGLGPEQRKRFLALAGLTSVRVVYYAGDRVVDLVLE